MKKYIFGNWKMYLDNKESIGLAKQLAKDKVRHKGIHKINDEDREGALGYKDKKNELAIFPSTLSLVEVVDTLKRSSFSVGAQNCAWTPKGAYTGAVSALMLKDAGCKYVLVGHSERRHIFGETNRDVRKKLEASLDAGLVPVLCVGETAEDKENGKTKYRLEKQLAKALDGLNIGADSVIVAYEPVWAIGTGNPCNPADADDMHGWIKQEISKYIKGDVPVLYGGSVNAENVVSYLTLSTVDGVLVGGASTKKDSFLSLIKAVNSII